MMTRVVGLAAVALSLCGVAHAGTLVNFDNLPQGPSYFADAGPMQTITYPGVATFSGGVVLGLASAFPANIYASNPNQYGTSSFGDASLQNALSISIAHGFAANEVSFALFNGETYGVSYDVDAYSGSTLVASEAFSNVSSNYGLGYVLPDLKASGITSVSIAPSVQGGNWDFLIDDVAFNESVQQAVNPSAVPEPSSLLLMGSGMLGCAGGLYRRMRRA